MCQNYSRVCKNHTLHVKSRSAYGNRTPRAEINFVRVEITLVCVVITLITTLPTLMDPRLSGR
jgi:hypothetical protein